MRLEQSDTERLLAFLQRWNGPLPKLKDVAELVHIYTHYRVWAALRCLHQRGQIAWRCGTRSEARGHQAIRVLGSGKVLKTAGCPFEPPST